MYTTDKTYVELKTFFFTDLNEIVSIRNQKTSYQFQILINNLKTDSVSRHGLKLKPNRNFTC